MTFHFVRRIKTSDQFHAELAAALDTNTEEALVFAEWLETTANIKPIDDKGEWIALWETLGEEDWAKLLEDFKPPNISDTLSKILDCPSVEQICAIESALTILLDRLVAEKINDAFTREVLCNMCDSLGIKIGG